MTMITKSLATLDAEGARDHVRRDYVDRTRLQALGTELRLFLDALGTDPEYSHEGISGCFSWDASIATPAHLKGTGRPFGPISGQTKLEDLRYRWICVYPVTGSSEGHYVHVDLFWQADYREGRVPLFLLKTFGGSETAIRLAGVLCRLLGV